MNDTQSLADLCRFTLADSLLVAETYAAIAIHFENLDEELIAFLELICYFVDTLIRYLGNMQEAIGTRKNFNKGSKIHDFSYGPQIDLTNFSLLRQLAYHTHCCLRCGFVGS